MIANKHRKQFESLLLRCHSFKSGESFSTAWFESVSQDWQLLPVDKKEHSPGGKIVPMHCGMCVDALAFNLAHSKLTNG